MYIPWSWTVLPEVLTYCWWTKSCTQNGWWENPIIHRGFNKIQVVQDFVHQQFAPENRPKPKRKRESIPTIHFQGAKMLVSGRVTLRPFQESISVAFQALFFSGAMWNFGGVNDQFWGDQIMQICASSDLRDPNKNETATTYAALGKVYMKQLIISCWLAIGCWKFGNKECFGIFVRFHA